MNETTQIQAKIQNDIEKFIDQTSLKDVLEMIHTICCEKSEYIRDQPRKWVPSETWQDAPLAKSWEGDAKRIKKILIHIQN